MTPATTEPVPCGITAAPGRPDWLLAPVGIAGAMLAAIVVWVGWHLGVALFVSIGAGAAEAVRTFVGIVGTPFRRPRPGD
jgi:hypothetical protein